MRNSYLKKKERSQIKTLTLQLKGLENKEQSKPKFSRRKETIKIRAEISDKEKYHMILFICGI